MNKLIYGLLLAICLFACGAEACDMSIDEIAGEPVEIRISYAN